MEGKVCSKCGEFKLYIEFYKDKKAKDKHFGTCKSCEKIKSAEYRDKNKEKISQKRKEYCLENKEEVNQYKREYYLKNKENFSQYRKQYLLKNKERLSEKRKENHIINKERILRDQREYRAKNKESIRAAQKKHRLKNREMILKKQKEHRLKNKEKNSQSQKEWKRKNKDKVYAARLKRRSLKHSVEFRGVKRKELLDRDNWKCQICNVTVHDRSEGGNENRHLWDDEFKAHIDHIIPISKGGDSTPENLRVLCRTCNLSKSDKTDIVIKEDGQIALFI